MKYIFLFIMIFIISCDLPEGEGGNSKIRGYVYMKNYNSDFSRIIEEFYIAKEDVYIIYGNDTSTYHYNVETHWDGSFEFRNLRKGSYTVYAYSKDTNKLTGLPLIPIRREVKITENDKEYLVEEIVIID